MKSEIRNPKSEIPLHARQLATAIAAVDRWMFAPGGTHTITPMAGEGSAEVTLRVDETTAAVLNASLARLNAEHAPQRAYFDKEHDEKAGATAWPVRFIWSEQPQPGVYCELEPSALGRQLIEGKVMRAFSPSFLSDAALPRRIARGQHVRLQAGQRGSAENPARLVGLCYPACGTLTNNPAFKEILPLWARNAGAPSGNNNPTASRDSGTAETQHERMKLTPEQKAALQARKTELEQQLPTLRAKAAMDPNDAATAEQLNGAEIELETATTKLNAHDLAARNEELETALRAQRAKDADAAVADAIKRGALAARDTENQELWKKKCIEDPSNIIALAAVQGSPALQGPRRLIPSQVQITQEDIRTVLKAYGAETDPLKRGALYARNISKRLDDIMDLPIRATDTYYGDLVVQRTLELLRFDFPMLTRVTTDFSQENASYGQAIKTRIVTPPSVVAYHTTNGYVPQTTTTADVTVTINNHSSVPIKFDANVLGSTMRRLFDEQLPAMQYSLGKAMVDALYALITTGNFTNTPTTEAQIDFDRSTVIAIGSALTAQGVPQTGRTLLLNSNYYGKLMEDTVIANLGANQRADIITGNRLPQVHGFEVIEAANLPSTGNLTGFGFSKSALVLATRVPTDVSNAFPGVTGGAVTRVITNPDTGMSVLMIQHVAPILGHAYLVLAWMYGVAAGQVAAGQILRSSS